MKAIIMAGGYGTRLKPLTNSMPKPMVPIIDKPLLEHTLNHLKSYGVTDITLTLGYRPFDIVNYFGDGEPWGVHLKYYIEHDPLGTAGSVKNAVDFQGDFIVLSGDALTNINLREMVFLHRENLPLLTMAVKEIKHPVGLGIVEATEDGQITKFVEKPPYQIKSALVNTGIYVMHTDVLDFIPDGYYDFSRNLFPNILESMYAYRTDAYWSDIGTLESYYTANRDVALNPEAFRIDL